MVGDSNLAVRQTDGTFALKEISLAPYQSLVQKLCYEIDVELTHVNRSTNRHADSLATDASKISKMMKLSLRSASDELQLMEL